MGFTIWEFIVYNFGVYNLKAYNLGVNNLVVNNFGVHWIWSQKYGVSFRKLSDRPTVFTIFGPVNTPMLLYVNILFWLSH